MSELTDLKKYLDSKLAEINRRFDKNDQEHRDVNNHLAKLNGQVEKNTCFKNKYQKSLEALIGDREHRFRLVFDLFWKALLVGTLLLLGLENLTSLL